MLLLRVAVLADSLLVWDFLAHISFTTFNLQIKTLLSKRYIHFGTLSSKNQVPTRARQSSDSVASKSLRWQLLVGEDLTIRSEISRQIAVSRQLYSGLIVLI